MPRKTTGTVFNTKPYPVDLEDGSILAPSETRADVELDNEHNRNLVLAGTLNVVEGFTPRTSEAEKADTEQEG